MRLQRNEWVRIGLKKSSQNNCASLFVDMFTWSLQNRKKSAILNITRCYSVTLSVNQISLFSTVSWGSSIHRQKFPDKRQTAPKKDNCFLQLCVYLFHYQTYFRSFDSRANQRYISISDSSANRIIWISCKLTWKQN